MRPVGGSVAADVAECGADKGCFCGDQEGWTTDLGEFCGDQVCVYELATRHGRVGIMEGKY
jgi:hypothetical protein